MKPVSKKQLKEAATIMGRYAGSQKSEAKAASSRVNGKLGGLTTNEWKKQISKIREAGRRAFLDGKTRDDCPIPFTKRGFARIRRDAWMNGYLEQAHKPQAN